MILLLDTFFYVCVWKGATIDKWEKAKYHEDPNYASFAQLLEAPLEDAKFIMQERFPFPRFFITFPNETNERKIKARVNPGSMNAQDEKIADGNYFTEDVSLNVFM